jgi:hypothetical protein
LISGISIHSPVANDERSRAFDFQLIDEPVQAHQIDPGPEPARHRADPESLWPAAGWCPGHKAAPDGFVYHFLELPPVSSRFFAKLTSEVVIEGEGRAHLDIMMPGVVRVKMRNLQSLGGGPVPSLA